MREIKNIIKKYIQNSSICKKIANVYLAQNFSTTYYGQNGEDIFLSIYFRNKENGFYIDIGAHHPIRFSNTYQLYQKGWHGINIDPLPGCMTIFNKMRPRDINLELGIGKDFCQCVYYDFNEPAYNTCNKALAEKAIEKQYSILNKKININIRPLDSILDKYSIPPIDLLTIDVEGLEFEVLSSNNWDKYCPQLIIMESLSTYNQDIHDIAKDKAVQYLTSYQYRIIGKFLNAVFLEKKL